MKRPYKNFNEFLTKNYGIAFGVSRIANGEFPCLWCRGQGWQYDPNDPPCPVEGNKLRDRQKCLKCDGARTGPRADAYAIYKDKIDQWKRSEERRKKDEHRMESIMSKLSDSDRKFLDSKMSVR